MVILTFINIDKERIIIKNPYYIYITTVPIVSLPLFIQKSKMHAYTYRPI